MNSQIVNLVVVVSSISAVAWGQGVAEYGIATSKVAGAGSKSASTLGSATAGAFNKASQTVSTSPAQSKTAPSTASSVGPMTAEPKIIEIPGSRSANQQRTAPKRARAIFVLANGRQIESEEYTITNKSIHLTEPQGTTMQVPLRSLNVAATVTANRKRGIELRIPAAANEVVINF